MKKIAAPPLINIAHGFIIEDTFAPGKINNPGLRKICQIVAFDTVKIPAPRVKRCRCDKVRLGFAR